MPLLPIDEPERTQVLDQLVDQVLKYRKVACPYVEHSLSDIYSEIYESLKVSVRAEIEDYAKLVNDLTAETIQAILTICYPKVLTNTRLTQLAIALQKQTKRTPEWGYAQRELLVSVYASKKLLSAAKLQVPKYFYEDVVQEILMEWGIQKIDNFNPERSAFMTWINRQLQWKKSEVMARLSSIHEINTDFETETGHDMANTDESPPLSDFLRDCTETCDHGDCQTVFDKHMRNRPEITFRAVFYERYLLSKSWKDVSIHFGGQKIAGLEHFLKRNLPQIIPCLHDCIEDKLELWNSQH